MAEKIRDFTNDIGGLTRAIAHTASKDSLYEYLGLFEGQHLAMHKDMLIAVFSRPDIADTLSTQFSQYLLKRGWKGRIESGRLEGRTMRYACIMPVNAGRNYVPRMMQQLTQLRELLYDYRKNMNDFSDLPSIDETRENATHFQDPENH